MSSRRGDDDPRDEVDSNPYAPVSADSPSELPSDESILWTGQPDPGKFLTEIRSSSIMAVIPLAMGLFLIGSATWIRFSLPAAIGGLAFLGVGAYLLLFAWRYYQRLKRVVYAITDQRAIVLRPVAWCKTESCVTPDRQAYSFDVIAVRRRQLRSRGAGRFDIVMGREKHVGAKGLPRYYEVGFLGLTDASEPERYLQQLVDSSESTPEGAQSERASASQNSELNDVHDRLVSLMPAGDDDPVKLVGESTQWGRGAWLEWIPYVVAPVAIAAVLIPWGRAVLRIWQAGLMQALPIPLLVASLVFVLVVTWPFIERWWLPPCRRYELDGRRLKYWTNLDRPAVERSTDDIVRIRPIQNKSRIRGYLIQFEDGRRLYIRRSMTHADDLYLEISSRLS
ncbi:MAG: hypothetical protein U0795_18335 [Pirellulales bacterium]